MSVRLCPIAMLPFLAILGCSGVPSGIEPVRGFELDRYMGKWYEIARLDHSFERGLEQVSAEYSLRPDGKVRVLNRGFDPSRGTWKSAEGKAKFVGERNVASLAVSFFGPFYGGYHVVELEPEGYSFALVCGPSRKYLWILARTPTLDPVVFDRLVARARSLGFDVDRLIRVRQDPGQR